MESSVMTRVFFCERCFKRGSPKKDEFFVVYMHDHEQVMVHKCQKNGVRGYMPHFVLYEKQPNGWKLTVSCGCVGCGTVVHKISEEEYDISFKDAREIYMNDKEFEVLKNFTDTGYKI
jgi:hypothetical protein